MFVAIENNPKLEVKHFNINTCGPKPDKWAESEV